MKKKAEKRLSISKIKIASLSKSSQQAIQGGQTLLSKCAVCPPQQQSNPLVAYCQTKVCQVHI